LKTIEVRESGTRTMKGDGAKRLDFDFCVVCGEREEKEDDESMKLRWRRECRILKTSKAIKNEEMWVG